MTLTGEKKTDTFHRRNFTLLKETQCNFINHCQRTLQHFLVKTLWLLAGNKQTKKKTRTQVTYWAYIKLINWTKIWPHESMSGSPWKASRLFQQFDLHLKICLKILIKNIFLYGSERSISSIMIICQELLCMFNPNAVMATTHAAMGGSRWGSLLRRPSRRGVLALI